MAAEFGLVNGLIKTVLAPRKSEWFASGTSVADPPVTPGNDTVLKSGLPDCPYRFLESAKLPFTPGIWLTATSSSLSGVSGSSGVGRLLDCSPSFWVEELGKVCYGNEQDVILDDGLGPRSIVVSESGGRCLGASTTRSSGGIVYVGDGIVAPSEQPRHATPI